jgi:hypothetical protein
MLKRGVKGKGKKKISAAAKTQKLELNSVATLLTNQIIHGANLTWAETLEN